MVFGGVCGCLLSVGVARLVLAVVCCCLSLRVVVC